MSVFEGWRNWDLFGNLDIIEQKGSEIQEALAMLRKLYLDSISL